MSSQHYCPKCGALIIEGATLCKNCGSTISTSQLPTSSTPSYQLERDIARKYFNYGLISAVVSLILLPEIFGSAAIILGAYSWKKEVSESKRGLQLIILGIVGMILGIYFTSFFALIDIFFL